MVTGIGISALSCLLVPVSVGLADWHTRRDSLLMVVPIVCLLFIAVSIDGG